MQALAIPKKSQLARTSASGQSDAADATWKERARKLGDMVYGLEVQKVDLQKRLEVAEKLQAAHPEAVELRALHDELKATKAKLEAQEMGLSEREKMLKIAAGRARAEVLALRGGNGAAPRGDLIPAVPGTNPAVFMSPGKTAHVDVATVQSMVRKKDKELAVLREDSAAKEKELMHALDLLQQAHTREVELRREACNLSSQLELLREALQQSDCDLDALHKAIEGVDDQQQQQQQVEDPEELRAQLDQMLATMQEQLGAMESQLAVAQAEAQAHQGEAAALQAALQAGESRVGQLEDRVVELQVMVEQARKRGVGGKHAAAGVVGTVLLARGLTLVLGCAAAVLSGGSGGGR